MRANTPKYMPNSSAQRMGQRRYGFTLLELLVVIGLTALLFGLVFKPLFDSFNLTSRSGTQIETQQHARDVSKEIEKALANAVFVYDNSETPVNLWFPNRGGSAALLRANFAMLECVTPSRQLDQQPGSAPIDPTTGGFIEAANASAGGRGFALPLAPGRTLTRYFVGLITNFSIIDSHTITGPTDARTNGMPSRTYGNKYETPDVGTADNRYTLYKAEVAAYIPDPTKPASDPTRGYVPNLGLFHTRNSAGVLSDSVTDTLELHDPNFFYDNSDAAGTGDKIWAVPGWIDLNRDGKVQIWENWKAVSSSLIPTDKVDIVAVDRDENTRALLFDGATNGAKPTGVRPLITFAPTAIENDPAVAGSIENTGNEVPDAAAVTFSTRSNHWANPSRVTVYRHLSSPTADPLSQSPLTYYQYVPANESNTGASKIVRIDIPANANPPKQVGSLPNVGPDADPATGVWRNAAPEFAFVPDTRKGVINFGFPASVYVHDGAGNPLPSRYSPADINAGITTATGRRFAYLGDMPTTNWGGAQLNPTSARSPIALLGTPLGVAPSPLSPLRIVPGSERVYGPDQRSGPNYGNRIQYTRVSSNAGSIGANEYKINYSDVPNAGAANANDPRVRIGYIEFNSQPDTSDPNAPNAQFPAIGRNSLPLYRVNPSTGQIDSTLTVAPIEVYYSFQMNRSNDVVKADYLTRELMNVSVELRLYDPRSARPQNTTLTTKVKVRNLPR